MVKREFAKSVNDARDFEVIPDEECFSQLCFFIFFYGFDMKNIVVETLVEQNKAVKKQSKRDHCFILKL